MLGSGRLAAVPGQLTVNSDDNDSAKATSFHSVQVSGPDVHLLVTTLVGNTPTGVLPQDYFAPVCVHMPEVRDVVNVNYSGRSCCLIGICYRNFLSF